MRANPWPNKGNKKKREIPKVENNYNHKKFNGENFN